MRIGIISVNNAHNYGTCMQAYAFKEYLTGLGHEVQIINHRIPKIEKSYMIYQKVPKEYLASKCMWAFHNLRMVMKQPYIVKRRKSHERFFEKYYNQTPLTKTLDELRQANYDFDVVFAGSDQIWNSEIIGELSPAFFCDFLGKQAIRASYAASIGKDELTDGEQEVFRKYLNDLDYISVREEKAKELLGDLTDKEIAICLDPTLVADSKIYDQLLKKPKFKEDYIYAHLHHFKGKGEDLVKATEELSQRTGLPVVHNLQNAKFSNELGKTRSMGPDDVMTTIANAKIVVTQSFHVTVFSLIFRKNFITLARDKFSDRMENLLHIVGLDHHYVKYRNTGILPELEQESIDYDSVHSKLEDYRKESVAYLNTVLSQGKQPGKENYFKSGYKENCYGCSLCKDICPVGAITMEADEEGYVYPRIDQTTCTSCGKCEEQCIHNQVKKVEGTQKAYLAYHADEKERLQSSAGGIFPVLAAWALEQGGYVVGVRYNEEFQTVYDIAHTKEECEAFRGAKYVEPLHGDIYNKTQEALATGKPVVFIGSSCKIAGLKNYLGKEYENLYLVDIVCLGTAPYKVFAKYLKAKEFQAQCKVVSVKFLSKEVDKEMRMVDISYEDTTRERVSERKNVYTYSFINGFLSKPSCYACGFCGNHRIADITIGDRREDREVLPTQIDYKGYSVVQTTTEKGERLLKEIAGQLSLHEITMEEMGRNTRSWHEDYQPQRATVIREVLASDVEQTIDTFKLYHPAYVKR